MSRLDWQPGVPTLDGMYWFDTGFRAGAPLILQMKNNHGFILGAGGSGPLSMVYHKESTRKASYTLIPEPLDWVNGKEIKGRKLSAWVKHPLGYLGFAMISSGWHNDMQLDVVWLDHPTCGSSFGGYEDNNKGYLYCLTDFPIIEK
jgi:hypothetical protein